MRNSFLSQKLKAYLLRKVCGFEAIQRIVDSYKLNLFLGEFFKTYPHATILQIGANGIAEDPIDNFYTNHSGAIVLIEPIDYLAKVLREKYADHPNIAVSQCLIGSTSIESRSIYYIPPQIADEMDGDGPPNRWAHGQGSFSPGTIEYWIEKNSFRGKTYRNNMQRYKESIVSETVCQRTLAELANEACILGIDLLIIDVQGAELEVISSLGDMTNLPSIIMMETDGSMDSTDQSQIRLTLHGLGYIQLFSGYNSLWIKIKSICK